MKYLILLLFFISMFGCINKPTEKKLQEELSIKEIEQPQDSLFVVESLRDTLYAYMDYVDTIPNYYNFPIVYYVEFYKSKSDTIVSYTSRSGLVEFINTQPLFIGATQIRNRNLVICFFGFNKLNNILNENSLSLDYLNYLDTVVYKTSDMDFMITYATPIWKYKWHNGHLLLIEKNNRGMDRIRKKLGR